MFFGEYAHTLDAKGRIIIPSKFREELGEKFIITKGLDNCLFVYSLEEWGNVVAKLRTLPFTDADVRKFIRFFSAGATECEPDKQGRVVIPQTLREHAQLEKDLYITGAITRLEIWNKERWEKQSGEYSNDADKIAEKMSMLGI